MELFHAVTAPLVRNSVDFFSLRGEGLAGATATITRWPGRGGGPYESRSASMQMAAAKGYVGNTVGILAHVHVVAGSAGNPFTIVAKKEKITTNRAVTSRSNLVSLAGAGEPAGVARHQCRRRRYKGAAGDTVDISGDVHLTPKTMTI
eukprot:jgi/Undpi1/12149/HiC_scaffold_5.g01825.m1